MKASPGARSWIAAGVRHELLTRALPAMRHDMASPVSVIRMGLLLLKRQGVNPAESAAAWEERLGQIEEQLKELVEGVRSLRHWELATRDESITRSALVVQCTTLMRSAFELNGIGLHTGDGLAGDKDDPQFAEGAALRYMFLGVLGYLHDGEHLGAIRIDAAGADALLFSATRGEAQPADPLAGELRAPRKLAIDGIALQSLADDLGYGIEVERDLVRLRLTPGA